MLLLGVRPETGVAPASRRCSSARRGRCHRVSGCLLIDFPFRSSTQSVAGGPVFRHHQPMRWPSFCPPARRRRSNRRAQTNSVPNSARPATIVKTPCPGVNRKTIPTSRIVPPTTRTISLFAWRSSNSIIDGIITEGAGVGYKSLQPSAFSNRHSAISKRRSVRAFRVGYDAGPILTGHEPMPLSGKWASGACFGFFKNMFALL